ncbi:phosphatase PAP2 family protein [Streptomyces sp. Ru73]|uniref:phosphatase PAP2 family protein n=1 Tax=Streptomyces sp. Ru73 TaxID=2080748 RepID=UPI002156593D|nr:phosphatase PAP2 family protein [Streptomyces sp. Ru73]
MRQRLLAAVCCPAHLGAGQAARYGLMTLLARPRPPHRACATHASGWAFPSGHTTTAALTAELLLLAAILRVHRGRTPLAVLVCCWAGLVGLTRVHLGVHWPSDVIGGWLFALGWIFALGRLGPWTCGTALHLRRSTPTGPTRSSAPTAPQPPPEGT